MGEGLVEASGCKEGSRKWTFMAKHTLVKAHFTFHTHLHFCPMEILWVMHRAGMQAREIKEGGGWTWHTSIGLEEA